MNEQNKSNEITLNDIIKILYRWKHFLLIFNTVIILIALLVIIFLPKNEEYTIFSSFLTGSFRNKTLETEENINAKIHSISMINKLEKLITKKELIKLLKITPTTKDLNVILRKNWRKKVYVKRDILYTIFSNKEKALQINQFILNDIIERHRNMLNILKTQTIADFKRYASFITTKNQIIPMFNSPQYYYSQIITYPDEYLDKNNNVSTIKFIAMVAIMSLFFSLAFIFFITLIKKIDWINIKNS